MILSIIYDSKSVDFIICYRDLCNLDMIAPLNAVHMTC